MEVKELYPLYQMKEFSKANTQINTALKILRDISFNNNYNYNKQMLKELESLFKNIQSNIKKIEKTKEGQELLIKRYNTGKLNTEDNTKASSEIEDAIKILKEMKETKENPQSGAEKTTLENNVKLTREIERHLHNLNTFYLVI